MGRVVVVSLFFLFMVTGCVGVCVFVVQFFVLVSCLDFGLSSSSCSLLRSKAQCKHQQPHVLGSAAMISEFYDDEYELKIPINQELNDLCKM